jgi:hypothetical protein
MTRLTSSRRRPQAKSCRRSHSQLDRVIVPESFATPVRARAGDRSGQRAARTVEDPCSSHDCVHERGEVWAAGRQEGRPAECAGLPFRRQSSRAVPLAVAVTRLLPRTPPLAFALALTVVAVVGACLALSGLRRDQNAHFGTRPPSDARRQRRHGVTDVLALGLVTAKRGTRLGVRNRRQENSSYGAEGHRCEGGLAMRIDRRRQAEGARAAGLPRPVTDVALSPSPQNATLGVGALTGGSALLRGHVAGS